MTVSENSLYSGASGDEGAFCTSQRTMSPLTAAILEPRQVCYGSAGFGFPLNLDRLTSMGEYDHTQIRAGHCFWPDTVDRTTSQVPTQVRQPGSQRHRCGSHWRRSGGPLRESHGTLHVGRVAENYRAHAARWTRRRKYGLVQISAGLDDKSKRKFRHASITW